MMKTNDKFKDIRNLLKQSIIVLCNSIYQISQKRRFLMRLVLPNRFSDICKASQPVSELYFLVQIFRKRLKSCQILINIKEKGPEMRILLAQEEEKFFSYNYNYGRGRGSNRPFFRRKRYLQQRSESDRQKRQTEQILEKNVTKVGRLKYHVPQ